MEKMEPAWHPNEDLGLSSQELCKSWEESTRLARNTHFQFAAAKDLWRHQLH